MLGPVHLAPVQRPSCQLLPICPGGAQYYHWCVWANPANPASPHGHLTLPGFPPLIRSSREGGKKPPVLSMCLFCTTSSHTSPVGGGGRGEGNLAVQFPSLSLSFPKISCSLIRLEMMVTEQVVFQGGILDCACCPSPSCRD